MRTAAYLRYSSDKQRDASITDQLRNIKNHCHQNNWPDPTLYKDEATSGALLRRAGLDAMLQAAMHHEFDILLIDDFSRLGRDMAETPRIIKRLKFAGIRVIAVSGGLDTDQDGYKIQMFAHGLMGEMYLDDLAKKTHRGLTGQALAGKSAGGISYGYKSVAIDDGFTRKVNLEQASWIVWMYEQYAAGHSPRAIASKLNEQQIPASNGGSWSHSAIYGDYKRGIGILCNRMYNGEYIWNRSQWIKDPTTGKRKRIERPESEWIINQVEHLRIVTPELWQAVQKRQLATRHKSKKAKQAGINTGGRGPKYLFSGLLKCGNCGGNYNLVNRTHYGCAKHKDRGNSICDNHLTVKKTTVEQRLLAGIKQDLLSEKNYKEFEKQVHQLLKQHQPDIPGAIRKAAKAEKEVDNIMSAIRQGIITPSTKAALETAETGLEQANNELLELKNWQPSQILPRAREIYKAMVLKLEEISDVAATREAIKQLTGDITLVREDGKLTAELKQGGIATLHSKISMVAGAGYVRYLPVRIPLT